MELADLNAVARVAPLRVRLAGNRCDQLLINQLKDVICAHPGEAEVFVHLDRPGDEQVIRLADSFAVDTSNGLVGELRALLGAEAVLR